MSLRHYLMSHNKWAPAFLQKAWSFQALGQCTLQNGGTVLQNYALNQEALFPTYIDTKKMHPFRELSFFTVCLWGDQNFLGWSKGGQVFFSGSKGGPEFFEGQRGGDQIFSQFFFCAFILRYIIQKFLRLRRNLSLYPTSGHITCSYIIRLFFSTPKIFTLQSNHCPLHCLWGPKFFLRMQRGGPEKIGDWPSQTDAPLQVKMIAPLIPSICQGHSFNFFWEKTVIFVAV